MAYWIKFSYEREIHVVDLDQISAFVYAPNGRLTFWLPESAIPVVLTPQSNPEAHCAVLDYLKQRTTYFPRSTWIRMPYDRSEYYIDLSRISAADSCAGLPARKLRFGSSASAFQRWIRS